MIRELALYGSMTVGGIMVVVLAWQAFPYVFAWVALFYGWAFR